MCENNSLVTLKMSGLEVLVDTNTFEAFFDCLVVSSDAFKELKLLDWNVLKQMKFNKNKVCKTRCWKEKDQVKN